MTKGTPEVDWWVYLLAPLPAVFLGAFLMNAHDVSAALWLQQIGAAVVGSEICVVAVHVGQRSELGVRSWLALAIGAVALIAVTILFPGVDGVRRWIPVGPVRLHAASIALPVLLLALDAAKQRSSNLESRTIRGAAILAAVLLIAQPDASQATAFAVSAGMVLLARTRSNAREWLLVGGFGVLAALAWTRRDPLEPVPHVEGIVGLAAETGAVWVALGIASLALLPAPFLLAARRGVRRQVGTVALAVYLGILCVMPFLGAYPVPLLGFGLSPILGYYIALAWLVVQLSQRKQLGHEVHVR